MHRRHFLHTVLAASLVTALRAAVPHRPPRILLRSSWQVVNIGDIAHTPGVLALIEDHIPDAEMMLWASGDLSPEVAAMEQRRFPKLKIVKGTIDADGKASNAGLAEAVEWADFLLHGSGPSLVAAGDVAAFARHTGKPYGVYGITHGSFFTGGGDNAILSGAKFAFFRDSVSLEKAKTDGVTCPVMEFGPDGAFACDVRDDAKATAFLRANNLEDGKFLCCIPRLRWTPYWEIRGTPMDARANQRHARNEAMAEQDPRDAAQGARVSRGHEPDGGRQALDRGQAPRRRARPRGLARAVLADRRGVEHLRAQRRDVRPGDAFPDHVCRQRGPGHRLPVRGADQQGNHVARHRPR